MQLYSTKNKSKLFSLEEAVVKGLPDDNGLFMPFEIPLLPKSFFQEMQQMPFQDIAYTVAQTLVGESVPKDELIKIVQRAVNFEAPIIEIEKNIYVLELFHGPTLAFKDFGARFMSGLLQYFVGKQGKKLTILVATSGDTGGAVASGFYDVEGIEVIILYPSKKVSGLQEKQLTTLGKNITALEVDGTFDDCQHLVKQAFLDKEINEHLKLTSANSINIARLIPQTFYYFNAVAQLKTIEEKIVFSVPSGNFGNLTAGLIAKRMGLPIQKFIAATNANDIVPNYLLNGVFSPKASVGTISNAMDVGNPSNFYRMMDLYENDLDKISKDIVGISITDQETKQTIKEVFENHHYTLDPHGAVGYCALKKYAAENSFDKAIFLETAHPAKFPEVVEEVTQEKIILPEQLSSLISKTKSSVLMSKEFDGFKEFLLNN